MKLFTPPPIIAKESINPVLPLADKSLNIAMPMGLTDSVESTSERSINSEMVVKDYNHDDLSSNSQIIEEVQPEMVITTISDTISNSADKKSATNIIIDKASVSIRYGILGLGQAGGKVADAFAGCRIPGKNIRNYPAMAVNTSKADLDALNKIPPNYRFELPNSHLGAMRQPELGYKAIMQDGAMEKIVKLCGDLFVDVDQVIVAAGIGGGTGTGTLQAVCETLVENGYNVIPMITLPRDLDSLEEKKNAVDFLGAFQEMIGIGMVSAPIIVDNNLLYNHYVKNAAWDTDWKQDSNQQIVKAINEMNAASGIASQTTLDGAELLKIQRSGGCSTIGKAVINISTETNNETILETLQEELSEALHYGLLCDYPKLNEARAAGVQVLLPSSMTFGVAMEQTIDTVLKERMPTLISKFVGYVPVDGLKDIVIYTLVSGLNLPDRVNELMQSVTKEIEYLAQAEAKRTVFQTSETTIRNPFFAKKKKALANPFAINEG